MTDDFFRSRLDQMIEANHPLAVLASRLPWERMQAGVAPQFAHKERPLQQSEEAPDLAGTVVKVSGGKASNAGRPRLSMRLMIALTLLKNSFDLSDEELVQRFAENVYWQHFAGFEYFDPRPPCDATQIGRFRSTLGEAGLEELLSATIHTAVDVGAIKKNEFKRVIVDTTVQEKAIAHPVDSRLLEIARRKVVAAAKRCAIVLKQTFAAEGKTLQRQAGGYAHAKQFKRLRRVVKRQRTILGILIREAKRKMQNTPDNALALNSLNTWLNVPSAFAPNSARTKTSSTRCTPPKLNASAKARPESPMSSASRSVWPSPTSKACWWVPEVLPATPMTGTPCQPKWSKAPSCCKT
jgi:IS5 family transposase